MKNNEKQTFRDLKVFVESLNEKQLDQEILVFTECDVLNDIRPVIMDEDYYIDPEDPHADGCCPESEFDSLEFLKKVYDKGTPILNHWF